jgi:hypothetical protein
MSKFNQAMDMANVAAMREMEETVWVNGIPVPAIIDPVELTNGRVPGGKGVDTEFEVYMAREKVDEHSITKGTKLSFAWGGETKRVRVGPIEDDGTNLLALLCHGELKGGVPGI